MTEDRPTTPWLTTEQAASYLSVSGGTLRNWRSSGAPGPATAPWAASSATTATTSTPS